jgi:hypothetical protein
MVGQTFLAHRTTSVDTKKTQERGIKSIELRSHRDSSVGPRSSPIVTRPLRWQRVGRPKALRVRGD